MFAERAKAREDAQRLALTDAVGQRRLAELLAAALEHRGATVAQDCPVCLTPAVLDETWVQEAQRRVHELRGKARALDAADKAVAAADESVQALVPPVFAVAADADRVGLDAAPLDAASQHWGQVSDEEALTALVDSTAVLVAAAASALSDDNAAWQPLARRTGAWLDRMRERTSASAATVLKEAERALGAVIAELREERLRPIADGARRTWQALNQHSNVTFEGMGLERSGNTRRARIDVRVDGSESAALAVLSQGELNALALSVFLPRATLTASPFRFAVIDDPVQAMDPAKVDGLARVLHEHGKHRQIIVFTHDARLPDALIRLDLDAQVIEVQRDLRSQVSLRPGSDVIHRYCGDAQACVRDEGLGWDVRARIVAGACRNAIEAGAARAVWRRRLVSGDTHAEIEEELRRCRTTNQLVTAAFREDGVPLNPMASVKGAFGPAACDALRDIGDAAHGNVRDDLDLPVLVRGAQRLALGLAALPAR